MIYFVNISEYIKQLFYRSQIKVVIFNSVRQVVFLLLLKIFCIVRHTVYKKKHRHKSYFYQIENNEYTNSEQAQKAERIECSRM